MSDALHKVMVIGAGLGLTRQIAAIFPEPKPAKQLTDSDRRRLAGAEAKRARRAAKLTRPTE